MAEIQIKLVTDVVSLVDVQIGRIFGLLSSKHFSLEVDQACASEAWVEFRACSKSPRLKG